MTNPVNVAFWQQPPWQGGGAKHRLGLRPVTSRPVSPATPGAVLTNKQQQLSANYNAVVAVVEHEASAQSVLLHLPEFKNVQAQCQHLIADCALAVREDLCLIDVQADNRLVAACVCAPSYWRLLEKIGLPLARVHAPVQGLNQKIGGNIERFFQNMPQDVVFARDNWFLHGDNGLFQPTSEHLFDYPQAHWVMRCEYQTLYKLTSRYVLFAIRIVCEPLQHMVGFPDARSDLLSALQRMDADEIEHFGGQRKWQALVDLVQKYDAQAWPGMAT